MGFTAQQHSVPGTQAQMDPIPDCGENTYQGSGKLLGKKTIITGGDSGIGRDVAGYVTNAGRKCALVRGDQGGDRQLLRQPGSIAGREGNSGQQPGAGSDLDTADPLDQAAVTGGRPILLAAALQVVRQV